MGLGKTIQTLALILKHPRLEDGQPIKSTLKMAKSTILVVPLALTDQWQREVKEKTNLRVYIHHGPKREQDPAQLAKWDIVITTYETVSSEYFNKTSLDDVDQGRGVFRVNWWRIVLGSPITTQLIADEAHTIKNRKAKLSQACTALNGRFRWCLTGTPYQNSVDDVYSLINFLRIPPFNEWSYWRSRITSVAKNGNMSLALTRLRTLLRAIMLRRTKDVAGVDLPVKEIIEEELEFDATESAFYNDLQERGLAVIEELKKSEKGLNGNYMCLLTMLLRLRQGMHGETVLT
jgi:SNF2 family DNA or RNA helicase